MSYTSLIKASNEYIRINACIMIGVYFFTGMSGHEHGHVSKMDGPVLVCSDGAKVVLSSGLPVRWRSGSGMVGGGGRDWLATVSVAEAGGVAEDDG